MSPKYVLEAALTVRKARTDTQARELAAAGDRVRSAREGVARVEARLEQLQEARRASEAELRSRLEQGLERAGDLVRFEETRRAESHVIARCADELERAKAELAARISAEQTAARALEAAFSEQRAVERHREGWEKAGLSAQERADDDQAMEAWRPERLDSLRR